MIISILAGSTKGNYGCKAENTLTIQAGGTKSSWGRISGGFRGEYAPSKDGSTILTTGDGSCLAIDFSGASGADAMLVMTGPGAPGGTYVEADGRRFSFLFPGCREAPTPRLSGDTIIVGGQTVSCDDARIVLAK